MSNPVSSEEMRLAVQQKLNKLFQHEEPDLYEPLLELIDQYAENIAEAYKKKKSVIYLKLHPPHRLFHLINTATFEKMHEATQKVKGVHEKITYVSISRYNMCVEVHFDPEPLSYVSREWTKD